MFRRKLLPAAANRPEKRDARQQTVDGSHGVLEIQARSSYVPNSPIGVRSPVPREEARLNATRGRRAWECRYG
jgi:hypothetical protein